MVKGAMRSSSSGNDGKWFAHPVPTENEPRNRETCTSTGILLTQVKSALPQVLNFKRYPKWKTQQESIEFPFSDHDNKHTLDDSVFSHGRKKCLYERGQHISHLSLHHDKADRSTEETRGNTTVHQADFMGNQAAVNVPTSNRRFPRNHQQKSAVAALAQAGEHFMWFGRQDSDPSGTLQLLAVDYPAHAKPWKSMYEQGGKK